MSWTLSEKVTIVTKPIVSYDYKEHKSVITEDYQGFVVEYGNKNMLDSAMNWAKNKDTNPYPKSFDFENKDFKLTIAASANYSSQGGKLSFMNCWIEKDGNRFLIGINSDLLVELIKNTTFVNGTCQSTVCFARKDGQTGALVKSMDSYKEAMEYLKRKEETNKNKTTKWIPGHIYSTTTKKCMYYGEVYLWYKFDRYDGRMDSNISIYKKLNKPVKKYLIMNKTSYGEFYELLDKLPSRHDDGAFESEKPIEQVKIDTVNKIHNEEEKAIFEDKYFQIDHFLMTLDNKNPNIFSNKIKEVLNEKGYVIEDT